MENIETYATSDLGLASYLDMKGYTVSHIEQSPGHSDRYSIHFNYRPGIVEDVREWNQPHNVHKRYRQSFLIIKAYLFGEITKMKDRNGEGTHA